MQEPIKNKPPIKRKNEDVRDREYLLPAEVAKMVKAAKERGRHGDRDGLMLSLMYHHGMRVSELCELRWTQIDFARGTILLKRKKDGDPGTHFLDGDDMRQLRKLLNHTSELTTAYVFISELYNGFSPRAVHKIVKMAGEAAKIPFPVHPHMLRHARGYVLANKGYDTRLIQGYLGHKDIRSTQRYTMLDANRYAGMEQ